MPTRPRGERPRRRHRLRGPRLVHNVRRGAVGVEHGPWVARPRARVRHRRPHRRADVAVRVVPAHVAALQLVVLRLPGRAPHFVDVAAAPVFKQRRVPWVSEVPRPHLQLAGTTRASRVAAQALAVVRHARPPRQVDAQLEQRGKRHAFRSGDASHGRGRDLRVKRRQRSLRRPVSRPEAQRRASEQLFLFLFLSPQTRARAVFKCRRSPHSSRSMRSTLRPPRGPSWRTALMKFGRRSRFGLRTAVAVTGGGCPCHHVRPARAGAASGTRRDAHGLLRSHGAPH